MLDVDVPYRHYYKDNCLSPLTIVVSKDRYYYNVIPVLEICPPHVNTTSIHNQTHGVLDLGPCTKYKYVFIWLGGKRWKIIVEFCKFGLNIYTLYYCIF